MPKAQDKAAEKKVKPEKDELPRHRVVGEHTERLPVKLTEPELRVAGHRLAQLQSEIADQVDHRKAVMKDLAAEQARLEAERSRVALTIRTEEELRDVPCYEEADYKDGMVRTVRRDLKSVVRSRALNDEERQGRLFEMRQAEAAARKDRPMKAEEVTVGQVVTLTHRKKRFTMRVEQADDGFLKGTITEGEAAANARGDGTVPAGEQVTVNRALVKGVVLREDAPLEAVAKDKPAPAAAAPVPAPGKGPEVAVVEAAEEPDPEETE